MRILFIGKRHYTNKDALRERFGRIYQLPMQWHESGKNVALHLIDYHGDAEEQSSIDGFPVRSHPVGRIASLLSLRQIGDELQPDIVVASGDCLVGLLGLHVARRTNARFVFDIYDDYRTFGANRVFLGWDAMAFLCRRASLVTYASQVMRGRHRYECASAIVPNGIDATRFAPIPVGDARDLLNLPAQDLFVGYFGTMAAEHGVGVLIDAIQNLRLEFPNLRLLICGKRPPATHFEQEWIIYRGVVPHTDIPTYLSACNVLALPYLHSAFLDAASSCKIAEYLACSRPIVATRTPNFVENFPEQAFQLDALLSEPGNVASLADAIRHQLINPLIVDPPSHITWQDIAARAAECFDTIA